MYIDVFFFFNACLDFLVISLVDGIAQRGARWWRKLLAASIGAMSACLFLILPTDSVLLRLCFGFFGAFLMASIAFIPASWKERIKWTFELYIAAMLMNGALNLFYGGTGKKVGAIPFLLLAGICCLGFRAGFFLWNKRRGKRGYQVKVALFCRDKKVVLSAMLDTGNHLYTYEGHRPVHVAEREAVCTLLDENPKYHMVAYQAVGTEEGALLAVTMDQMLIQKEGHTIILKEPVIGLYEHTLSPHGNYHMLLHADTFLEN